MRFKIYDSGMKTFDRYTVYFLDDIFEARGNKPKTTAYLAMSENPFHPQGFCQHGEGVPGKHNGKVISFDKLPPDCQQLVKRELKEYSTAK